MTRLPAAVAVVVLAFVSCVSSLSAQTNAQSSVEVISSTREAVTIRVAPRYETNTVISADGQALTEMIVPGGEYMDTSGAPGIMRIPVSVLLPMNSPARIELVSQTLDVLPNINLAPVPGTRKGDMGQEKVYAVDQALYNRTARTNVSFEPGSVSIFRTAYSQQIILDPIQFDASTRTVTRVKDAVYRISYPQWSSEGSETLSATERQFFATLFVNGDRFEFYRSARNAIAAHIKQQIAFKPTAGTDGTWLQLETTSEGMFHITAQQLADAGITGTIDPEQIELLGVGGWMLDENASDSSGEWLEHPFEVRKDGNKLRDIVFYAPGTIRWKYAGNQNGTVDGLYHRLNPYTGSGHFLLHVGGTKVGTALHVAYAPDNVSGDATPRSTVFASSIFEEELNFERPNHSREFVGRGIPRSDVPSLDFSVDAPGYTGDSTTIRVGYDATMPAGSAGYVTVKAQESDLGKITARAPTYGDPVLYRNWDNAIRVPSGGGSPLSVSLSFTSNSTISSASLDFIELMYRRTTDVGDRSIPFMLIDTRTAEQYTFQNAAGGEIWDVTYRTSPRVLATASADDITVSVQGVADSMRRFIAFSDKSLLAPKITTVSAPTLRSTIGQQGAQSIIITPAGFRQAADSLAHIRERGGQATEPLNVRVVNLEDIFAEFGYGSRDLTAIRDFLSYTFRHTVSDGTTVPLYVTLYGGGHPDYQARVATGVPNWIPVWESGEGDYLGSYRQTAPDPYPDDAFFAQVQPHNSPRQLDFAIGRVSARTLAEALTYAGKVEKYEHSSDEGDWRSVVSMIADDRLADKSDSFDGIDHFSDTEEEVRRLQSRIIVNKVYGASYPTSYTAAGRRKPTMESAILDAINSGSVLTSFVGHGNPHVWTHEAVLVVPGTIARLNNFDRLSYFTTATCDFSEYDDYQDQSGGVMLLVRPEGGAIGLLGTSRSVTGQENLVFTFYSALFGVDPALGFGTASVGSAYLAGKLVSYSDNVHYYYLLGDPSQRLLVPRYYVAFDSVNGALNEDRVLPALSPVHIVGRIVRDTGANAQPLTDFNGVATITLYDSPNTVSATSVVPTEKRVDTYKTEGPILYRGSATVKDGRFSASFIVPKDIKFDTNTAKITGLAFSNDQRSALGATRAVRLSAPDSISSIIDTVGPILTPFIGSRGFRSGDDVAMNSRIIVDVQDEHGLNTSTASIGHSFIAWVDDDMSTAADLAPGYVADQDNFQKGTSIQGMQLPAGHHVLHVRAFDTFDNPGFAEVEFVAKKDAPFRLYEVVNQPNPVIDHTIFRFTQPAENGALVNATLGLYTTDGRLVRTLHVRSGESVIELVWDGRDDQGSRVANGAYAFRLNVVNESTGETTSADGMCVVSH